MVAPFFYVLQDLLVTRFIAYNEQATARFFHSLQRVVVRGHARGTTPGELQRLQFAAELDGAGLLIIERVVVEEDLFEAGEIVQHPSTFVGDVVRRAQAPAVAGMGLRPEAEGTHGWTAARRIQRDEWVQEERNVVIAEIEIALVDLRCPGKLIQVFNDARLGSVNETSVFTEHDAGYLFERLT